MTNPKPRIPSLVAAAQAFEDELDALDALVTQLERASITSEKTLQRSGLLLEEASRAHERLGACLASLVGAINTIQQRQQVALDRVLEETRRVEGRSHELRAIMEQFAALGARARDVNGPVNAVVAQKESGAPPEALLESLGSVEQLIAGVVTDADGVVTVARAGNWPDVARDAQSLRQSMHAALNRLSLARREVAGRAPS